MSEKTAYLGLNCVLLWKKKFFGPREIEFASALETDSLRAFPAPLERGAAQDLVFCEGNDTFFTPTVGG
jgi:hypothetical protein